nr:hypothetical protein [Tanacetum cinerariifolium]
LRSPSHCRYAGPSWLPAGGRPAPAPATEPRTGCAPGPAPT